LIDETHKRLLNWANVVKISGEKMYSCRMFELKYQAPIAYQNVKANLNEKDAKIIEGKIIAIGQYSRQRLDVLVKHYVYHDYDMANFLKLSRLKNEVIYKDKLESAIYWLDISLTNKR